MNVVSTARTHGLIVVVVATLLLVACGGGGSGDGTGNPPVPSGSVSLKATLVTGADGVALGVPEGTLLAPADITIETTPFPATALPASVTALGSAYRISATTTTDAPPGNQFMVGIPLPAGEDLALLAAAVFLPAANAVTASSTATPADTWTFLPLAYDSGNNMLFAPFGSLTPDGTIYALVRLATPLAQPVSSTARIAAGVGTIPSPAPVPLVKATCSTAFAAPDTCDALDESVAQTDLEIRINDFAGYNYPSPRWLRQITTVQQANGVVIQQLGAYLVEIVPSRISEYDPIAETLQVGKFDHVDSIHDGRAVVFFPFAYAYPNVVKDESADPNGTNTGWYTQSMARATTETLAGNLLFRDRRLTAWNPVTSLFSTNAAGGANAQDFWVFLQWWTDSLQTNGLGLFQAFLEEGARPEAIDAVLAKEGGLGRTYFDWVKDQLYEQQYPLPYNRGIPYPGARDLSGDPCSTQRLRTTDANGVETLYEEIGFVPDLLSYGAYDPDYGPVLNQSNSWPADHVDVTGNRTALTLDPQQPLSARLYQIELTAPHGYAVRIGVEPGASSIAYKIYDADGDLEDFNNNLPPSCADEPSNTDRIFGVAQDSPKTVLVLVAETAYKEDTGSLPVPATKIVIEKVGLAIEPATAEFAIEENEIYADTFTIINNTSVPVSYLALENVDWLSIAPGDESGIVPANGSVVVSYQATCPDPLDATDVSLLFNGPGGEPLTGPDVPSVFHVSGGCLAQPPACIDPARYDGYTATATLTWGDVGSRTIGPNSYSFNQNHSVQVTTTWQFSTNTFVSSGGASVIQEGTTVSNNNVSTIRYSGAGEAFDAVNPATRGPATVAAAYDQINCVWDVSLLYSYVDGEVIYPDGSRADTTLGVGRAYVDNVLAAGGATLQAKCSQSAYEGLPECAIGFFSAPSMRAQYFGDPPTELPPASFSWAISPILKP